MKPSQPGVRKARKDQSAEPKLLSPPPWRAVGVGIASLGTPVGIGVAHLVLGEIIAAAEVMVALTITGTALFGSQALSERAFRLLRWLRNRPEPLGPPATAGTRAASSLLGDTDPDEDDVSRGDPRMEVPLPGLGGGTV
jgi:hypothetical protein